MRLRAFWDVARSRTLAGNWCLSLSNIMWSPIANKSTRFTEKIETFPAWGLKSGNCFIDRCHVISVAYARVNCSGWNVCYVTMYYVCNPPALSQSPDQNSILSKGPKTLWAVQTASALCYRSLQVWPEAGSPLPPATRPLLGRQSVCLFLPIPCPPYLGSDEEERWSSTGSWRYVPVWPEITEYNKLRNTCGYSGTSM